MLNVVGLDVEINRGDAASLTVHLEGEDVPSNGTYVNFQIRKADHYSTSVIEKNVQIYNGIFVVDFFPNDTNSLNPGFYYWNACIQYSNGMEPWTIMRDWAKFEILPG